VGTAGKGRVTMAAMVLVAGLALCQQSAGAGARINGVAGWLEAVNWYRAASGLSPVVEDTTGNAAIAAHLEYLKSTPASLRTGQYANAHSENPASPHYTQAGAAAGGSSNLTSGSSSERGAIDSWMAAPFHAVGILRPNLQKVSFARDETGAAGLNVLQGLAPNPPARTEPVIFPGRIGSVHLTSFRGENPNPLETCGYSSSGLPLIAMLPHAPDPALSAELVDAAGTTLSSEGDSLCVVTANNYKSSDAVYGPTGKNILQGANAVFVIPRASLVSGGRYTARIRQPNRPDVQWSFYVSGVAGAKEAAGSVTRIHVSDSGATTVFGNLTVTQPEGEGFTTAYPCSEGRPLASNNNYLPGQTTPNFAVVRADSGGDLCVYTLARSHVIWDQVGQTTAFATSNATRKLDTRTTAKVGAGEFVRVHVSEGAATVLGNLTVTQPEGEGFTTVWPCTEARPLASNNNYLAGQTTPNFVAARADAAGDICLYTLVAAHLVWDQVGQTTAFPTANASRKIDTRDQAKPAAGGVVKVHVSEGAATVLGTLTVTQPDSEGFTTAYPCSEGRPVASNNNYLPGQTTPNFVVARSDAAGDLCLYTLSSAHLIWDQVGQTTTFSTGSPRRLFDSRQD
jgi:hypothetical protein